MEYRFVFCPAFGVTTAEVFYGNSVTSKELAEGQMNIIASYTLHLHRNKLMSDFSNFGRIEQKSNTGDWEEVNEDDL